MLSDWLANEEYSKPATSQKPLFIDAGIFARQSSLIIKERWIKHIMMLTINVLALVAGCTAILLISGIAKPVYLGFMFAGTIALVLMATINRVVFNARGCLVIRSNDCTLKNLASSGRPCSVIHQPFFALRRCSVVDAKGYLEHVDRAVFLMLSSDISIVISTYAWDSIRRLNKEFNRVRDLVGADRCHSDFEVRIRHREEMVSVSVAIASGMTKRCVIHAARERLVLGWLRHVRSKLASIVGCGCLCVATTLFFVEVFSIYQLAAILFSLSALAVCVNDKIVVRSNSGCIERVVFGIAWRRVSMKDVICVAVCNYYDDMNIKSQVYIELVNGSVISLSCGESPLSADRLAGIVSMYLLVPVVKLPYRFCAMDS